MTEYHRLARGATYRWWKPIVEVVLFAVLAIALILAITPAIEAVFGRNLAGVPGIVTIGLTLAMLAPASMLAAKIVGRPIGTLVSVAGRVRWRWLAACLGVAIAMSLLGIVFYVVAGIGQWHVSHWPGWRAFAPLAAAVVIVIPLQAMGEEFAFRATLMQFIGAWVPWPIVPIVISGIVFALAHDLPLEGFVAIASFGLAAAYLAWRTGGIEATIALHVINNVSLFLMDAATGRAQTWITQLNTDIHWDATISDVLTNTLSAVILARIWRRYFLATSRA